jgi:hypothetical protein
VTGPRQWLPWLAVAVLVAVAVATAGWGNDTSQRRHRPTPVPPPESVSVVRPVALVTRADLVRDDLPSDFHEVLARAGNDLDPGDRLHLCGAAVPPAAGRIAGHRRAFLTLDGRRVRTEVAAYADGDAADRALSAVRHQAEACSESVPPGRFELPSVLALHVRLDPTSRQPGLREVLVLRSGDALAVLETDGVTPAQTIDLARLVAARLEPSPPAASQRSQVSSDALASSALQPGDLSGDFTVQSDLYGRELDDAPGRDVCGRTLTGDARRVAAREIVLAGDGRRVTGAVSSYEPGGAAAVLRQVRSAVAACPRGPAPHRLRGLQSLDRRYSVVATHAGPASLTLLLTVTDRAGHLRRSEVVYQRSDRVLSVLTVDPVDGRDDPLVRRTAAVLAARLDPPTPHA